MRQFISHLNDHVFFWPGSPSGSILMGREHFDRYSEEDRIVISVPTRSFFAFNSPNRSPLFCQYNSGAPRSSGGKKSPRGGSTFQPASSPNLDRAKVKEVVFTPDVAFPKGSEYFLLEAGDDASLLATATWSLL